MPMRNARTTTRRQCNTMSNTGEVIVITGAGQGIGAAIATMAANKGYRVCINYLHSAETANQVLAEITDSGGRGIAVAADVGSE